MKNHVQKHGNKSYDFNLKRKAATQYYTLSATRYEYGNSKAKDMAFKCIFNQNELYNVIIADVQLAAAGLDFIIKLFTCWEAHSKKLNGWANFYYSKNTIQCILTKILTKYCDKNRIDPYSQQKIQFRCIQDIYNALSMKNPLNGINKSFVFPIWMAISKFSDIRDFKSMSEILCIIAKNQAIYCISNYISRKKRPFYLPWECAEGDSTKQVIIKYQRKIQKQVLKQFNLDASKSKKINSYFKPIKKFKINSTHALKNANQSDDESTVELLAQLADDSQYESDQSNNDWLFDLVKDLRSD